MQTRTCKSVRDGSKRKTQRFTMCLEHVAVCSFSDAAHISMWITALCPANIKHSNLQLPRQFCGSASNTKAKGRGSEKRPLNESPLWGVTPSIASHTLHREKKGFPAKGVACETRCHPPHKCTSLGIAIFLHTCNASPSFTACCIWNYNHR